MKRILFILLILTFPVFLSAAEPERVWKSKNGKVTHAAYDTERDTDPAVVPLVKNGKHYRVRFDDLSKSDRDYVTKIREKSRSFEDDFPMEEEDDRGVAVVPVDMVPDGNRYALLIGVNEYNKPIRSLEFCVNDMKLLAMCFEKTGVPKDNIFLVTDDSPSERRPTGANIRQQIENITQLMGPNDQLIIAFSGHGAMVDGKSYLCPNDTNLDDRNSIISRDWAFAQLEECKAKQKIFIIDACRDEVSFGNQKALSGAKTLEDPIGADTHGFILIASCDKRQKSWEHAELKHGVFTYYLAEGLSGAVRDEDGYVSIMNLFQYASAKTKKFVIHEFNKVQVPTFRPGGEMTDFCLAKLDGPLEPSASPIQELSEKAKAGDRKIETVNGVKFIFRWCPSGSFRLESPTSEEPPDNAEAQHKIIISKGFWIMETEVTQKQWKAVMEVNPSYVQGDNLPVENVSWDDCQEFCKKCTELGLAVQLPTETQWEYACRAGAAGLYAGNLEDMAWYDYNSGGKTHVVRSKSPNAWGLYDMHGNVREWCADFWSGVYPCDSDTDPIGPPSGSYHVNRGGSWISSAKYCRSSCRGYGVSRSKDATLGVRFVKSN